MNSLEMDDLIIAWYRYLELGLYLGNGPDYYWAIEEIDKIIPNVHTSGLSFDCELGWSLVLRMLELAQKRSQLVFVGEKLYQLVSLDQSNIMSLIEKEVSTNSRLAYVVSFIYTTDSRLRQRFLKLGCAWAELYLDEEREPGRQAKLEGIVQAYLEHVPVPPDHEQLVLQSLEDLSHRDPTLCWHSILQISERCLSKRELNRLANSLASFLSAQPGEHFLTLLKASVLKDNKVAYLTTRLRKTTLARDGWLSQWQAVIELAERQEINFLFQKSPDK